MALASTSRAMSPSSVLNTGNAVLYFAFGISEVYGDLGGATPAATGFVDLRAAWSRAMATMARWYSTGKNALIF